MVDRPFETMNIDDLMSELRRFDEATCALFYDLLRFSFAAKNNEEDSIYECLGSASSLLSMTMFHLARERPELAELWSQMVEEYEYRQHEDVEGFENSMNNKADFLKTLSENLKVSLPTKMPEFMDKILDDLDLS